MKTVLGWVIALVTSLVSLIAMCIFDFILSLIYYFFGKVPFLSEIIDFIGEILDLGLTVLVAALIANTIWEIGHSLIEKTTGKILKYQDGPIHYINNLFLFVFLSMFLFLGYSFITSIGNAVITYTANYQGFAKLLMFYEAIKDTFSAIRDANIIFYMIGSNAFFLFAINVFFFKSPD